MPEYAELEISLERQGADSFAVDLRFKAPDSDTDTGGKTEGRRIALDELRQLVHDPAAYGRRLGQDVFAFPSVRESLAVAKASGLDIRFRLSMAPTDKDLQAIRWELLADPDAPPPGAPLLVSERILFSRFVDSRDWRQINPRAKGDLRALVVVANPTDIDQYRLAPIDVAAEVQRARDGMTGVTSVDVLGERDRASMKNMIERLRTGPDIVYLVCHGALIDGQSVLWLEQDDGASDRRSGNEVVSWLGELKQPPRLVVLVSCQSAGTATHEAEQPVAAAREDVWDALGPRLGAAGVPAVLAMHGNVTMATISAFMPVFFRELQADGIVDRAVAVARGAIRDRHDAWAPVLFMRLKSGSLWSRTGFARGDRETQGADFELWPTLLEQIESGRCTPILGPGMTESLIGPRREIARSWAEVFQYPMAKHDQEDLPQVAQYVLVNQKNWRIVLAQLRKSMRDGLLAQLGKEIPEDLKNADVDALLLELARRRWNPDSDEPHWVLAQAPIPVFVTTAQDRLLAAALRAVGKHPREELFRWHEDGPWPARVKDDEPDYQPSVAQPLVYHLFGRLDVEHSLVITEDDYLDYLIGASKNHELISHEVRASLAANAFLFLGYEMDGWDFRVLYRSIMQQTTQSFSRRNDFIHAGVQVDLAEGRIQEVDRARAYLQSYFQKSNTYLYWGGVEDFARELRHHRGRPS